MDQTPFTEIEQAMAQQGATAAVEALITLGETRTEAERKVATALQRDPTDQTEALIAAALSVR